MKLLNKFITIKNSETVNVLRGIAKKRSVLRFALFKKRDFNPLILQLQTELDNLASRSHSSVANGSQQPRGR